MTMSMTSAASTGPTSAPIVKNSGFFASWRRSYRLRSKSSSASNSTDISRKKDTKSMENLLASDRTVPRWRIAISLFTYSWNLGFAILFILQVLFGFRRWVGSRRKMNLWSPKVSEKILISVILERKNKSLQIRALIMFYLYWGISQPGIPHKYRLCLCQLLSANLYFGLRNHTNRQNNQNNLGDFTR